MKPTFPHLFMILSNHRILKHWLTTLWVVFCCFVLFALSALAQQPSLESPPEYEAPSSNVDPSQDIFIEGLGFSKLIVALDVGKNVKSSAQFKTMSQLLERNLCWGGLFHINNGNTTYCRVKKPQRIDMQLRVRLKKNRIRYALYDAGPEKLLLFERTLTKKSALSEHALMDLANRIAKNLAGEHGLLGSSIAFAISNPRYVKSIAITNTHGRRVQIISRGKDISISPYFSYDGKGLIYTVLQSKGARVYYHNLFPNDLKAIKSRFITKAGSLRTGGSFSKTAHHVLLTISEGSNPDLYQVNLLTGKQQRITMRQGIETQANWRPGSNEVVFVSDRSGRPHIYMLDLDTGEDLRLTFDGAYNVDPKWSPDGKYILFTKRIKGVEQIHVMDPYGENVRQITKGRYPSEQPEWSPDGKQIVFSSRRTGDFKLYVVSTDGSNLRRLTRTGRGIEENSPTWTMRQLLP